MLLVIGASIVACSDPAAEARSDERKRVEDSLAIANNDLELIDSYIKDSTRTNVQTADIDHANLRYVVMNPCEGDACPKANEILSIRYVAYNLNGRFAVRTNDKAFALTRDSLGYVQEGLNLQSIMDHYQAKGNSDYIELALDSAFKTGTLTKRRLFRYVPALTYEWVNFNFVEDGANIPNAMVNQTALSQGEVEFPAIYSTGFIEGLKEVVSKLALHEEGQSYAEASRAEIYVPSALAYLWGSTTSNNFDQPLMLEVTLEAKRP